MKQDFEKKKEEYTKIENEANVKSKRKKNGKEGEKGRSEQ